MNAFKIRLAVIGVEALLFLFLAVPGFSQGQDSGQTPNKEPDILKFFGDGPGKWIVLAIAFAICKAGGAFGKTTGTNPKPTDTQTKPNATGGGLEAEGQVPPSGVKTDGKDHPT